MAVLKQLLYQALLINHIILVAAEPRRPTKRHCVVVVTGVSDESSAEPKHKEQNKLLVLVSGGRAPRIINHKTHEH